MAPVSAIDNYDGIAVIIGNRTYDGDTPAVDYAHNDAEAMRRFVIDVLGYREGNVIDLRDATKGKLETVFGNARDHRGQLFNWVKAGKSDVLVFYSGHGVPDAEGRSYLLPVDGDPAFGHIGGYPLDVLYANLSRIDSLSITVYLDTCFSGQTPKGYLLEGSGVMATPREIASPAKLTILTAAQADQMARWDDDSEHGLFTAHLLKALRGEADRPDWGDGDGTVTLAEVRASLDEEMSYQARRRHGKPQTVTAVGADDRILAALPREEAETLPQATTQPPVEPSSLELAFWETIKHSTDPGDFEDYLARFPDGTFATLADRKLGKLHGEAEVAALVPPLAPEIVVEPLDSLLVALRNANVRSGPSTAFGKVGRLGVGDEVTVTGKVEGRDWYRIALADGAKAYVWAPLLGEALLAAVTTPPAPAPAAPSYRAGETFRDCAMCPEMVVVPAGRFMMGSTDAEIRRVVSEGGERKHYTDELPRHEVRIPQAFAVGKHEVTFSQWDACVSAGGCSHRPKDWGWGRGSRPVIYVSWDDAQEYVRWLSRETGQEYRLLSEAEWEYAARAGTQTARHWGGSADQACGYANVYDRTSKRENGFNWLHHDCDDGYGKTAPVGRFRANSFGLHDMLGNVWEWTQDCYHGNYSGAPNHSIAGQETSDCSRVLRGGSWNYDSWGVRAAFRGRNDTGLRSDGIGFRVARTLF